MIINKETILNKINNASKITIFYSVHNTSSYAAASALNLLNNHGKTIRLIGKRRGISLQKGLQFDDSDLNLFLGIHRIPGRYLKKDNVIVVDDSFSGNAFSKYVKYYMSNKKNFARSESTSTAQFAYSILNELDVKIPFGFELLLMIGDRYDNRELGATPFIKEIAEKHNLRQKPNLVSELKQYTLFDFPTFLIFYDYTKEIGFEYETEKMDKLEYIINRINVNEFLNEFELPVHELVNLLEDKFREQNIPNRIYETVNLNFSLEDLLYAPSYHSYSLDEMEQILTVYLKENYSGKQVLSAPTQKNFWVKKSIKRTISKIEDLALSVRYSLDSYEMSQIRFNTNDKIVLYSVDTTQNGPIGAKWNWLPFFPWGSFLVEYSYIDSKEIERTEYMLYSKSNIHAGGIATFAAVYEKDRRHGHGNGEFFKASLFRVGKHDSLTMWDVLKNVTNKNFDHLKALDFHSKYHSQIMGEPTAIITFAEKGNLNSKRIDLYPPYSRPMYDVDEITYLKFKEEYDPNILNHRQFSLSKREIESLFKRADQILNTNCC